MSEILDKRLRIRLTNGPLFQFLSHPLVMAVPYSDDLENDKRLNAQLAYKTEEVKEAIAEGEILQAIWLHERPYRWDALETYGARMDDRKYFEALGCVWVDTENIWQLGKRRTQRLLNPKGRDPSQRVYMMEEEERATFLELPETLTIYRGCSKRNRISFSWTLDRKVAEFFAKRRSSSLSDGVAPRSPVNPRSVS